MSERSVWIVVVDDNEDAGGNVGDKLQDFPVFYFKEPEAAANFCVGNHSRYPYASELPQDHVILAFIDLWMGVGEPTGLEALSLLRDVDTVPVWAFLRSAEIQNDRELLAIAAAEVWGRGRKKAGIHYVGTDSGAHTWAEVRRLCDIIASIPSAPDGELLEQYLSKDLTWVKPLTFVRPGQKDSSLLAWLNDLPWRLEYLRLLATGFDAPEARMRAGAPDKPRDVAKSFKRVLGAHLAASPEDSWLDHDGRLILGDDGGIEGDNLSFILKFAERHRFLLGSKALPAIVESHLERPTRSS